LGKQTLLSRRHLLAAAALAAGAAPRLGRAAEMPAPGRRAWADQVPVLRIGLLGGENENDRLARYDKYHALLQDTFDIPVKLYPAADYAGVIQAFAAKQIEMAGMGASGYAAAYTETNGNVEPLVVAVEEDGSISYRSVMVVRADSGITSLADMKGHSLAWADPNSTSGYMTPSLAVISARPASAAATSRPWWRCCSGNTMPPSPGHPAWATKAKASAAAICAPWPTRAC
jgi:phosphonate transport system substrate-binding protein